MSDVFIDEVFNPDPIVRKSLLAKVLKQAGKDIDQNFNQLAVIIDDLEARIQALERKTVHESHK